MSLLPEDARVVRARRGHQGPVAPIVFLTLVAVAAGSILVPGSGASASDEQQNPEARPTQAIADSLPEVPYGVGDWDHTTLGNHRALVRVEAAAPAVQVHIPWRRRDPHPENVEIFVIDASTGSRVENVARIDVNREHGDLVFEAPSGPGEYHIYYLPHLMEGRSNYPTVTYPAPAETAGSAWLRRLGSEAMGTSPDATPPHDSGSLARAEVIELQSIDELNSYYPMEVIATEAETEALLALHPDAAFLLFPEDRRFPVRMSSDLPRRWIRRGVDGTLTGQARRGEFYAFQIGVFAARADLDELGARFTDLVRAPEGFDAAGGPDSDAVIPAAAVRCFNLAGVDPFGQPFRKRVDVPAGKIQAL